MIPILHVEDDEIDVELVMRLLKKSQITNQLHHARDGIAALEMLKGENGREEVPQPCLMLLDINMPRMNGFEFLEALREQNLASHSIVLILTTSDRDDDKEKALELNAAEYVSKENLLGLPVMIRKYLELIAQKTAS